MNLQIQRTCIWAGLLALQNYDKMRVVFSLMRRERTKMSVGLADIQTVNDLFHYLHLICFVTD